MSDLQQKLQANILDRLKRRNDRSLTKSAFTKVVGTIKKQFQTDTAAIEQAVEALLREQCVSRTARGTCRLETKGVDYLAHIAPAAAPPSEINEALIPYQKAFVLMHLFCETENSLTRSQLFAKLNQQDVTESGLFLRLSTDPPVNPDLPTAEWVVAQLVSGGNIRERKSGQGTRYWLTEHGQELLAATDQHPKVEYTLSGEKLNVLRETARHSGHLDAPVHEPRREALTPEPTAPPPAPSVLTMDGVLNAFEELRRERFARNGIVPVYELRRLLMTRHGAEAGSHAALDPLLKQMRREKQLRMIAINDLAGATTDQLDDSVPGENETFFYLESAHEYAHAR